MEEYTRLPARVVMLGLAILSFRSVGLRKKLEVGSELERVFCDNASL
jgi:hypothetical protein